MVLLDGVVRIRPSTGLGTVATVVRGDVLAKDNVPWATRLRGVLNNGFFGKNFGFWCVEIGDKSDH